MKTGKRRVLLSGQNIVFALFMVVSMPPAFTPHSNFDLLISQKIQSINSLAFDKIMWFVSMMGDQPLMVFIVGITGILLYLFKFRVEAIVLTFVTAAGTLSGALIKLLIDRPRPEPSLVRVSVWLADKSYPSNHVLVFTVFFGFLLYLLIKNKKPIVKKAIPALLLLLFIVSIGFSRIYLGVHWVTDVLGGYLLGVLWLIFTIRLYNSYHGKR